MPLNLEIGDLRVAVAEGVAGVAEAWQRIIFFKVLFAWKTLN